MPLSTIIGRTRNVTELEQISQSALKATMLCVLNAWIEFDKRDHASEQKDLNFLPERFCCHQSRIVEL
jgi:hypothetical protein